MQQIDHICDPYYKWRAWGTALILLNNEVILGVLLYNCGVVKKSKFAADFLLRPSFGIS